MSLKTRLSAQSVLAEILRRKMRTSQKWELPRLLSEYPIPYLGELSLTDILNEYIKPAWADLQVRYIISQYLKRKNDQMRKPFSEC